MNILNQLQLQIIIIIIRIHLNFQEKISNIDKYKNYAAPKAKSLYTQKYLKKKKTKDKQIT